MNVKNITKGEVRMSKVNTLGRQSVELGWLSGYIDVWYHNEDTMTQKEAEANAELICEAFNVANQTGLSPMQMKGKLDELRRVVNELELIFKDLPNTDAIKL